LWVHNIPVDGEKYIVMQCFRVVYRGTSHKSLEFSRYSHKPLENTLTNTVNATYVRCMMARLDVIPSNIQWLSCILIGCIVYGMV